MALWPMSFHREDLRRYDQPGEAQEFFAMQRVEEDGGAIPADRYLLAREQMRGMPVYSTLLGREVSPWEKSGSISWGELGPGNIGGRTRALVIDPADASVMFAAGVAGGIWKTSNGGGDWSALDDLMANLAVNCLAMEPGNSSVLYAGTGEGYFNSDAVRGAGIFKTTDGGVTWSHLSSTSTSDFYFVNDLVVSPNSASRVYAATGTGVWRSLNGGGAWTRVLNPAISGGCLDLAIRTDQATDVLFAACGTFDSSQDSKVYRNTDAGGAGTWSAVLTETNMGRTSLAIAPSNQNVVYACAASEDTSSTYYLGLHAVFRSTTGGAAGSWTARVRNTDAVKLNTVLLTNPYYAFQYTCNPPYADTYYNQGWYDNVIAVDPVNSDIVWAGGIDLFRSDDGGQSWGMASHWWSTNQRYNHADHHVIVFDPAYNGAGNQTMFTAGDGGVFRTDNARATTATGSTAPCSPNTNGDVLWNELNSSYGVTQFYHGVAYPGGQTFFGGTQDEGVLWGTVAGGHNGWGQHLGGDGGYCAVDPTDTQLLFTENTYGSIQRSDDAGATWASAQPTSESHFLFIAPFVMDQRITDRLWTGGWYMWRSWDWQGMTVWDQASAKIPNDASATYGVSAVAVAPSDSEYVLAGTSEGYLLFTSSGSTTTYSSTWPSSKPRTGWVSWVTFDPHDKTVAYATYSTFGGQHVWKGTYSASAWAWSAIDGSGPTGIPDVPVHAVAVDPADSNRLWVGTDVGVFVSTDGGVSWAVESSGFANVITEAFSVTRVNGVRMIYAFTHGRGVFRAQLDPDELFGDDFELGNTSAWSATVGKGRRGNASG
jgi:hypothetical protein